MTTMLIDSRLANHFSEASAAVHSVLPTWRSAWVLIAEIKVVESSVPQILMRPLTIYNALTLTVIVMTKSVGKCTLQAFINLL